MAHVNVEGDVLRFGEHLRVSFQRTLRVPEGARAFPLPPSFGRFPIQRIDGGDAGDGVESVEVVVPLRQLEALWIGFEGSDWRPHAVMIGTGGINAVTGEPWEERLSTSPQNYVVCPDQPWLDGINAGDSFVRQFVATPLGSGLSIGEQLVDARPPAGGLHVTVFAPKPGRFPDREPTTTFPDSAMSSMGMPPDAELMSLGAGGKIRQKIYPDSYGLDTWEAEPPFARATVHLLNSAQFRAATRRDAPPSPMDAETYARLGLPWFELYEEARKDLAPSERLARVKTVSGDQGDGKGADPDALYVRRLDRNKPRDDS